MFDYYNENTKSGYLKDEEEEFSRWSNSEDADEDDDFVDIDDDYEEEDNFSWLNDLTDDGDDDNDLFSTSPNSNFRQEPLTSEEIGDLFSNVPNKPIFHSEPNGFDFISQEKINNLFKKDEDTEFIPTFAMPSFDANPVEINKVIKIVDKYIDIHNNIIRNNGVVDLYSAIKHDYATVADDSLFTRSLTQEQLDTVITTVLQIRHLDSYRSFEDAYTAGLEAGKEMYRAKIKPTIELLYNQLEI